MPRCILENSLFFCACILAALPLRSPPAAAPGETGSGWSGSLSAVPLPKRPGAEPGSAVTLRGARQGADESGSEESSPSSSLLGTLLTVERLLAARPSQRGGCSEVTLTGEVALRGFASGVASTTGRTAFKAGAALAAGLWQAAGVASTVRGDTLLAPMPLHGGVHIPLKHVDLPPHQEDPQWPQSVPRSAKSAVKLLRRGRARSSKALQEIMVSDRVPASGLSAPSSKAAGTARGAPFLRLYCRAAASGHLNSATIDASRSMSRAEASAMRAQISSYVAQSHRIICLAVLRAWRRIRNSADPMRRRAALVTGKPQTSWRQTPRGSSGRRNAASSRKR
mmetsp:Transcript_36419/g.91609  ORF Transcript_36419/g.91609 Transcript_36419/m.91609 type:complete len:338 (-) Transcript_36419:534-1547(-)